MYVIVSFIFHLCLKSYVWTVLGLYLGLSIQVVVDPSFLCCQQMDAKCGGTEENNGPGAAENTRTWKEFYC